MGHVLLRREPWDEDAVVVITYVDPPTKRGFVHVVDSLQREYVTDVKTVSGQLVAALAEQYRVKRWPCRPWTSEGWPDRILVGIERAEMEAAS